jgi:hypothetical protein
MEFLQNIFNRTAVQPHDLCKIKPGSPEKLRGQILDAVNNLNGRMAEISPSKDFSDQYLQLISQARTAADANRWGPACSGVWEATFLVNRAIETINRRSLRIWLVLAPFVSFAFLWLLELLIYSLGDSYPGMWMLRAENFPFLWCGAVGGTTIAYWGLVKHTIQLDFDDQYTLWYFFKPMLGAVFGLVTVVVLQAGVFTLGGDVQLTDDNRLPLYIAAFLAGFSERFFMQLIDRVITAIFGGSPESSKRLGANVGTKPDQAITIEPAGEAEEK